MIIIKLIIDCDEVLSSTSPALLELYREETGDYSTDLSILTWNMQYMCPKWSFEDTQKCFINPRLFELMQPVKDSQEVLKYLKNKGHTIHIVSCHNVNGIKYKFNWLEKHFSFIDGATIIPVRNGERLDKSIANGDICLDDSVHALESMKNIKIKVCFGDFDWNKDWSGIKITNWQEFKSLVDDVENMNLMKRGYL